jgi:hypothetical protein
MYLFMITCYVLMFINLVNITLVGASGILNFSIFGASHTRFALFMILIFTITETVVMYFFISTGAAIKTAISEGLGEDSLWFLERKLKMVLFPQLMLTILLIGGWFIHIGAVENNMLTKSLHWPFFIIAYLHHLYTLKIKNSAFKTQLDIISNLEPKKEVT